jgi:hypothetical protein
MIRALMTVATLLASAPLYAYHLEVRSDNPLVSDPELRKITLAAGEGVRHNIPESQEVYVYASTRAKPRDSDPTKYIYFHRVELRRHFTSGEPYPSNGWYSIKSEEYYGVDDANGVKSSLEATLRRFFGEVKNLSPTVRVK